MTSTLFDLTGKVAIVTGASRGIGRGIALRLAEAGATVVVNFHDPGVLELGRDNSADAEEVVSSIAAAGGRAIAIEADISRPADVERLVRSSVDQFGGIDVLVNNAGICPFHEFLDMPLQLWQHVMDVNLTGAFLCSQAAARRMVEQNRGGRIISISSISASVGGSLQTHYTPTKAGIHSLMQSLAIVLGPHGITCNSVAPGGVATDINKDDFADPEKAARIRQRVPLGRAGTPDDIAGPVVFLASDSARYVNGASLLVDGGLFVNLQ
ncbi:MAG: SDR family NAD(P)-dependent oxidoreductase [Thermomicrobiales bacterium]